MKHFLRYVQVRTGLSLFDVLVALSIGATIGILIYFLLATIRPLPSAGEVADRAIKAKRYDLAAEITRDLQDTKNISVMARFCSYCGVYMGLKDGNGNTGPSHGICQDCKEEQLSYAKASAGRGMV